MKGLGKFHLGVIGTPPIMTGVLTKGGLVPALAQMVTPGGASSGRVPVASVRASGVGPAAPVGVASVAPVGVASVAHAGGALLAGLWAWLLAGLWLRLAGLWKGLHLWFRAG